MSISIAVVIIFSSAGRTDVMHLSPITDTNKYSWVYTRRLKPSDTVKQAHEYAFKKDEQHLSWLRDAYSRIESGDSSKYAPTDMLYAMPKMSVMDYANQIMQTQMNMMPKGMGFEKAA